MFNQKRLLLFKHTCAPRDLQSREHITGFVIKDYQDL